MIGLEVTGIDSIINMLKKAGNKKTYTDVLKQVGENAVKYAKTYAPEMTGTMMEHIRADMYEDSFILECDVPWAVFNEYGTIYMAVGTPRSPLPVTSTSGKYAFRPFLRPAVLRAMQEAPEIFNEKWKEVMRG